MFTRTRVGLKSIFCPDRRNAGYELELLRPVLVKLREKNPISLVLPRLASDLGNLSKKLLLRQVQTKTG
jgi:hypothetical protein